jgi:hypothetical protein
VAFCMSSPATSDDTGLAAVKAANPFRYRRNYPGAKLPLGLDRDECCGPPQSLQESEPIDMTDGHYRRDFPAPSPSRSSPGSPRSSVSASSS